jgi:hypothetical protein
MGRLAGAGPAGFDPAALLGGGATRAPARRTNASRAHKKNKRKQARKDRKKSRRR